ncbi:MAG TPA: PEFG-CTERM sorting domain-containing protein [Nitrosopumilaceae archaeon]|nr:PEFG-CTERM sorting domain-containing protein [Nitrosopumilaceae archaeon]
MSTRFKGFALLAILAAAVVAIPAFAQQENPFDTVPITVTTDKESYADGETIVISGESKDFISGVQVSVVVINPIGNVVTVQQLDLETDKTYSTSITAGGGLWKAAGTYTVKVQYGSDNRSNETTFEFSGSSGTPSGKKIRVEGTDFDVSYSITGGRVLGIIADIEAKSLIVSIETTSDGTLIITLPRELIKAEINGENDSFFVLIDGEEVEFEEESTDIDRTLTIHFQDGAEEIEIIGTWIIPEFGAIAALVLAVAIISIIAVSAKTRLRLMPKY